jgi:hypothetical protein
MAPDSEGRTQQDAELDALLDDLFTYHRADESQAIKYQVINDAAKHFARAVLTVCPNNPDRSVAVRKIREARMTANSAIATKSGGALPR